MSALDETLPRVVSDLIDQRDTRVDALGIFPLESLQHLDAEGARRCQSILGHGDTFGIWETPEEMIRYFGPRKRLTNLRRRIQDHLPAEVRTASPLDGLLDEGVLWLTKLGMVLRMGPAGVGKFQHQSLDASTVASFLSNWGNLIVARGIFRRLNSPGQHNVAFAVALTPEDLREFRATRHSRNNLRRLSSLQDRGLWMDAPLTAKFSGKTTSPRGSADSRPMEQKSIPYQPIPDDYLAAMGPRVLWLIQDLGPNLIV